MNAVDRSMHEFSVRVGPRRAAARPPRRAKALTLSPPCLAFLIHGLHHHSDSHQPSFSPQWASAARGQASCGSSGILRLVRFH